jgi:hypothetical protein
MEEILISEGDRVLVQSKSGSKEVVGLGYTVVM